MGKKISKEEYLSRLPEDCDIKPTGDILPNSKETEWVCSKGHIFKKKIHGVLKYPYCTHCNLPKNQTRYSYEDVVTIYKDSGYEFLDDHYVNTKHKHNTRCLNCGDVSTKKLNTLLSGRKGCSVCGKRKEVTRDRVESILREHGYTSWTGEIKTGASKLDIVCNNGDYPHYFTTTCRNILDGSGCPHCAQCFKMDTAHVNWLFEVQGLPYVVVGEYLGPHTTQEYQCKVCDTVFTSRYKIIQTGRRTCPTCYPNQRDKAFNERGEHILYYLRVVKDGLTVYKVGVTGKSVKERFGSKDSKYITVLSETHFETGEGAYLAERDILLKYSDYRYTGEPLLYSGNTEMFYTDVLGLDKSNQDTQTKAS